MAKFVRARTPNGSDVSMPEQAAINAGYPILDKPAYGRDGRLLPAKHRVAKGTKITRQRKPAVSADDTNPQASPASDTPEE